MKLSLLKTFVPLLAAVCLVFLSCTPSMNTVKRMQKMEEGVSNPTTKEELEEAIKKYDARAMDLVSTQAQEGIWFKILGTRYLDQGMYTKALESLEKAVVFYPDNANLYYWIGVCAGYLANSQLDYSAQGGRENEKKRMNYLRLSESAYERALSIDPRYYRAMYGIGVLYAFELMDESEKAIPYLEKFLSTQTRDTNAMFVLARAYYMNYEFEKAVTLYDQIITLKPNAEKVSEAEARKKEVLDIMHSN